MAALKGSPRNQDRELSAKTTGGSGESKHSYHLHVSKHPCPTMDSVTVFPGKARWFQRTTKVPGVCVLHVCFRNNNNNVTF